MRAEVIAEDFLEGGDDVASTRIARRNRTPRAGMAALEVEFADAEADCVLGDRQAVNTAFFFAEELIFPERGHTVYLECGAEALASFFEVHAAKQIANGLQTRGGNNGGAVSDGVVGKTLWGMAHGDGLLEELGKPLRGCCRVTREGKCGGLDFALVAGNRERDGAEVRCEDRADQVDCRGALAIHPLAVNRVERPGAIEFEPAARPDARLFHMHWIERFDGVQTNVRESRRWNWRNHRKILAEEHWKEANEHRWARTIRKSGPYRRAAKQEKQRPRTPARHSAACRSERILQNVRT